MSEHVASLKLYVTIFLTLMVCTILTVWVAYYELPGIMNVVVALTIAVFKATLVVLYFMHVRWSSRLTMVLVVAGIFWLIIMVALTLSDYLTRGWVPVTHGV